MKVNIHVMQFSASDPQNFPDNPSARATIATLIGPINGNEGINYLYRNVALPINGGIQTGAYIPNTKIQFKLMDIYYHVDSTNQQYTVLEMCNEFDVNGRALLLKTSNGINLNDKWFAIFNNSNVSNHYNSALSIINAVQSTEIDAIFNQLKAANYEQANDVLFLEVYYLKNKNNFALALNKLNEIIAVTDDEIDLKAILAIELDLLSTKKALCELSLVQQNTLKAIDVKQAINSAIARDLLQASNGKHDYRFKPTKQLTTKTEGKIISLLESSLLIYPNPASDNLTLQLVNATDGNTSINIFDAMGQRVFKQQANIKAGKLTIDISSYAKGMYLVQLIGADNKSFSNSFIKQ